jgi:hypothetical protein
MIVLQRQAGRQTAFRGLADKQTNMLQTDRLADKQKTNRRPKDRHRAERKAESDKKTGDRRLEERKKGGIEDK